MMSVEESEAAGAPEASARLHARSFKLRFAAEREAGRSYVSAVKPLRLPAVVRAKFYRAEPEGAVDAKLVQRALRRVTDMFQKGPREKYDAPVTSAQEYGWWWERHTERARGDRRLRHHIRDSSWLRERLRILAADAPLKRR